ncbi:MAG: ThiF family adenylyltransferase [Patescibacteria group bacterium]
MDTADCKTGSGFRNLNHLENHFHSPNPRRDALIPPLRGKRVVVVGLGGGAPIPIELLKCGVDAFDLVDFDILEPHNAIRHPCPAKYFGRPKVEAVAEFMRELAGSQVEINPHVIDVFKHHDTLKDLINNADLLIVATDSEASRFFLNEIAVETKTPAVYVGMYENGSGGEIFAAMPGQACYACLSHYNQRETFMQQYRTATRKGDCSSNRDTLAMPGLGIDQGMLALIAARKSVEILLRGVQHSLPPAGGNWIVFSIFGITKILESPLTCFQGDLAQHSKCFACGDPY